MMISHPLILHFSHQYPQCLEHNVSHAAATQTDSIPKMGVLTSPSDWNTLNIISPGSYDSSQQHSWRGGKKKTFAQINSHVCKGFFHCKFFLNQENKCVTQKRQPLLNQYTYTQFYFSRPGIQFCNLVSSLNRIICPMSLNFIENKHQ